MPNKVVAIIEKAEGNASVGDMWLETKIFDSSTEVDEIMKWAKRKGVTGKIILTVPDR